MTTIKEAIVVAKYTGKFTLHGRTFYQWEKKWSIDSRNNKWWVNVPNDESIRAMSGCHAYDCARYLAKGQGIELEAIPEIEELKAQRKKTHDLFMHKRHDYAQEVGVDAYTKF